MIPWLETMSDKNQPITDSAIRNKAREVASTLHIGHSQFKASSGWVDNFKRRHNIRKGVYTSDGPAEYDTKGAAGRESGPRGKDHSEEIAASQAEELQKCFPKPQITAKVLSPNASGSGTERFSSDPRLQNAFETIFLWISAKGPDFISIHEETVLQGLAKRI